MKYPSKLIRISGDFPQHKLEDIAAFAVFRGAQGSCVHDDSTLGDFYGVDIYCEPSDDELFVGLLDEFLSSDTDDIQYEITVLPYEDQDWSEKWKENYYDVKAGVFKVMSSFSPGKPEEGEIPIFIDPSMAFGTGQHETTRLCLEELSSLHAEGMNFTKILDMGCGSGILSIGAARLWGKASITGIDNDPDVIPVAEENALKNTPESEIYFGLKEPVKSDYELIIANINPAVLVQLKDFFFNRLKKDGILLLSGIINDQAGFILESYGINPVSVRKLDEWVLFRFENTERSRV
ncbi:MAG: 50S ribosomal protein L11 methyltransferase [Deltaproteobacteria bacterium]|nr:50S ribosomal protein L11 methyltransferase [Deltaproteobacteria bacterium]